MLTTSLVLSVLGGLALAIPSQGQNLGLLSLLPRQELFDPSILPEQCIDTCAPFFDKLNECNASPSDQFCGCDSTTRDSVAACLPCLVEAAPEIEPDIKAAEESYEQGCAGNSDGDSTASEANPPSTDSTATTTAATEDSTATSDSSTEPDSDSDSDSESDSDSDSDSTFGNGASPLAASFFVSSGALVLVGLLF